MRVKLKQDDYKRFSDYDEHVGTENLGGDEGRCSRVQTISSVPDDHAHGCGKWETGLQDQHDVLMGQIVQEMKRFLLASLTRRVGQERICRLAKQSRHLPHCSNF